MATLKTFGCPAPAAQRIGGIIDGHNGRVAERHRSLIRIFIGTAVAIRGLKRLREFEPLADLMIRVKPEAVLLQPVTNAGAFDLVIIARHVEMRFFTPPRQRHLVILLGPLPESCPQPVSIGQVAPAGTRSVEVNGVETKRLFGRNVLVTAQ